MATKTDSSTQRTKKTKKKKANAFHQRLASLTFHQAQQLLGENGQLLMGQGRYFCEIEPDDVFLGGDLLRAKVRDCPVKWQGSEESPDDESFSESSVIVTLTLQSLRSKQILVNCDHCDAPCHHMGAVLAYLLDAKSALGLAAPPDESVPLENLTEDELQERALAERAKRAQEEPMRVKSLDPQQVWTDYVVTSHTSGKSYRVALRGTEQHTSYCSCPDFRTNGLGTCKHILHTLEKAKRKFGSKALEKQYQRENVSLRLHYGDTTDPSEAGGQFGLRFNPPADADPVVEEAIAGLTDSSTTDARDIMQRLELLENGGRHVTVYPDAEAYIQRRLVQEELAGRCQPIRENPADHPLRTELLSAELLPYQLDGIAFAVSTGRAILADDMGLGKTIQGIGTAELLAQWADIRRVLVIGPASLKSQWGTEITRFSGRSYQLVMGNAAERKEQYASDAFFTICNYEQVLRDIDSIEANAWDLIILDEGQRIKNWESKTSNVVRSLDSPFRLVLSGTPLENNLGELFTVARFVDEQRLGSAYSFFHKHRIVDDKGKTIGYHRLDDLRQTIGPILLRRTRGEVSKELPERIDQIVRVTPTEEQLSIHHAQMQTVAQITGKKFLTEMDLMRLRRALAFARMSCDSTYLIDQTGPEYSSKLERLHELLEELLADPTRKIVLFSEWKRMLDRVALRIDQIGCDFTRLDGSVPQKRRPAIVSRFQDDPECRVLMMTNAGATGLNLQSANVIINCDLPWNPAVLEQRIARAHRMGQKNAVHIYNLVSSGTIEEGLLQTLASKQDLANASLDADSEVNLVGVTSGTDDLRRRLEQMNLPGFGKPIDQSKASKVEEDAIKIAERRAGVSKAAGDLVGAALSLAGNLVGESNAPDSSTVELLTQQLSENVERDEAGNPEIKIRLDGEHALRDLATTLAKLITAK